MTQTIADLSRGFESSSGKTPEFLSFVRTFRSEFTRALTARGCTEITYSVGHFEVSGFFTTPDGGLMYFNTGDVRYGSTRSLGLLYRTAEHRKDYTGGRNRHINYSEDMAECMDLQTVAFQQV